MAFARSGVLGLLAIGLLSCSQNKVATLARCQLEADKFYQGYQTDDTTNPRSRFMIACMKSDGYDFDISSPDCDSKHALPTQPSCYVNPSLFFWIKSHFFGD
jgi:hypothetical protein